MCDHAGTTVGGDVLWLYTYGHDFQLLWPKQKMVLVPLVPAAAELDDPLDVADAEDPAVVYLLMPNGKSQTVAMTAP